MRPKTSPSSPEVDIFASDTALGFELEDAVSLGDDDAIEPDYELAVLSFDLETDADAYVDPPLLDD